MKIAINTTPLLLPLTGVGTYTSQLAQALARLAPENDYNYYYGFFSRSLFTVKPAGNVLEIDVVNGWWNRVLADEALPADQRLTKTNIRIRESHKKDKPQPQPAGLLGPVTLWQEK